MNNKIITDNKNKKTSKKYLKKVDIKKWKSMMEYTDDELNDLSYDEALKNNKRFLIEILCFINKNKAWIYLCFYI